MGNTITLTAEDGFSLGAYLAVPEGTAKGGITVIQEIFGVNSHIRSICDRLAAQGYAACAPALFDRQERGFQSGYSPEEVQHARSFLGNLDWDAFERDTRSAVERLREYGSVGTVGFCLGGSISFLAALRIENLAGAVCFYGGQIKRFAGERPACPVQMHFGAEDASIPLTDVEEIRRMRPEAEIHVYDGAGHGFNCDERASYNAESAAIAWERASAFLDRHIGKQS